MRTEVHELFRLMPEVLRVSREWHANQQYRAPMHPVIEAAFQYADPEDAQQLCLEWPYVATTDKTRLAYTANDAAGEADRQTLTSVGKYLKRHFPKLADHVIRDLVAKYATASTYEVSTAMEDIINAVQNGPPSCMQWSARDVSDLGAHPYETYAPIHGWAMAIRKDGAQINGRALVMQRDPDSKYFVRTYKRPSSENDRYSGPDEELSQWLQANGYKKEDGWAGEKLAYLEPETGSHDFIAPYIDGNTQSVSESWCNVKKKKTLCIEYRGDYECTSQSGGYEGGNTCTCDGCGNRVGEDDLHSVGYDEDTQVCDSCIDSEYTLVYGRRRNQYYIPQHDAVCVGAECYDPEYLSENGIVELHDGEYCNEDDAVYVESRSEYYLMDECTELHDGDWALTDDCTELHDGNWALTDDCTELHDGDWALTDDTWCCAVSGDYYLTDDVDPVVIHGVAFHPDTSAEDIAEAIKDKTGQKSLFTPETV